MKGPIRTLALQARRTTTTARCLAMAAFVFGLTACSTDGSVDDVLSMRPSVGVGDQTSGITRADRPRVFEETGRGKFQQEPSYREQDPEPQYGNQNSEPDYGTQDAEPAYGGEDIERRRGEPPQTLDSRRERIEQGQEEATAPARPRVKRAPKVQPAETQPEAAQPEEDQYDYFGRKVGTPGAGPAATGDELQPGDEAGETSRAEPVVEPVTDVEEQTEEQSYEAGYPRMQSPVEEPRNVLSADEVSCRRELKKLGVKYQDLAPIRDSQSCFIDHPVKVSALGSVQMKPAATLTCRMALTFAQWTKNELVPSARWRYFSGVKTIRQGSSYSCRRIAGSRTQSSHSQGNALDVMAIDLKNGKSIDVRKQGLFAFRARKLLNNVRADGCEYFTTVLGPGYNYDHRNHFHFDLMERRGGKRACH